MSREYRFTLTEHDSERPWIVRSQEHRAVSLDDGVDFFEWAHERWPAPRWKVELDPFQLSPAWPRYVAAAASVRGPDCRD